MIGIIINEYFNNHVLIQERLIISSIILTLKDVHAFWSVKCNTFFEGGSFKMIFSNPAISTIGGTIESETHWLGNSFAFINRNSRSNRMKLVVSMSIINKEGVSKLWIPSNISSNLLYVDLIDKTRSHCSTAFCQFIVRLGLCIKCLSRFLPPHPVGPAKSTIWESEDVIA